ncbi:6428_t:CDS:2 [Diversispora eburnea]|uniref:6428_t:CDS:1 n=1 Tax=Diversispora eburnea TaxID=1213867 RepID=A0A9N8VUJ1_9GLOM|nr:6428_t:CDS:2 [Diversispora eburnea]
MDLTPLTSREAVDQKRLKVSKILFGAAVFSGWHNTIEKEWPLQAVGRYGSNKEDFDYSPKRVRKSVEESCNKLDTNYLDVVYCHDVEFVNESDVKNALMELFELKPLDIILSYSHLCLHNTRLASYFNKFRSLDVSYIINASPLSMGLLREKSPPDWHPAPLELREAVNKVAKLAKDNGLNISELAIQFSFGFEKDLTSTVIGFSNAKEVEESVRCWNKLRKKTCFSNEKEKKVLNEIKKIMEPWINWSDVIFVVVVSDVDDDGSGGGNGKVICDGKGLCDVIVTIVVGGVVGVGSCDGGCCVKDICLPVPLYLTTGNIVVDFDVNELVNLNSSSIFKEGNTRVAVSVI